MKIAFSSLRWANPGLLLGLLYFLILLTFSLCRFLLRLSPFEVQIRHLLFRHLSLFIFIFIEKYLISLRGWFLVGSVEVEVKCADLKTTFSEWSRAHLLPVFHVRFFKNWDNPCFFLIYFCLFKLTIQTLQLIGL